MKTSNQFFFYTFLLFSLLLLQLNCTPTKIMRRLQGPDQINTITDTVKKSKVAIKIHMKNGGLYVLNWFATSDDKDTLTGLGNFYNANRKKVSTLTRNQLPEIEGEPIYKIAYSDIALVETNTVEGISRKILAMGLVGVPTVLTSVYCLANPKACFGSCPTFYSWNGTNMKLMAEGFSSSILRTFEKSDIDMLYWSKTQGKDYPLRLTNEALETHVIRYANLLVFPKKGEERVFATNNGKFFKTDKIQSPAVCKGSEGDCRNLVLQMDAKERFSEADSKNLATREFINLEFNTSSKSQLGLIIGARQTLLTTYLFYQSLSYVGNANGYFASRIESGDKSMSKRVEKIWNLLGGIEIFVQNSSGKWIKAGEIDEMGPIASDVHLVMLPRLNSEIVKVRLKMTKGLWRIDYIGLTESVNPVQPTLINPSMVLTNDSINKNALSQLCDTIEPLITLPGDSHTLHYTLPEISDEYEIFLKSKGYYLEWMREEWMAEKNLHNAYLMFGMPKLYLKLIAGKFKEVEPTMEENFWRSRYVKN